MPESFFFRCPSKTMSTFVGLVAVAAVGLGSALLSSVWIYAGMASAADKADESSV